MATELLKSVNLDSDSHSEIFVENLERKWSEKEGEGQLTETLKNEDESFGIMDDKLSIHFPSEEKSSRRSLRYSIRSAYKALKLLTKNKKLDFDPKIADPSSSLASEEIAKIEKKIDDKSSTDETESLSYGEIRRKLRKKYAECLNPVDRELWDLKASAGRSSRTIESTSRSTSGESGQFVDPEPPEDPPSLSKIPEMTFLPRRNRDRCLSCMYKSLDTKKKAKPLRTLEQLINVGKEESLKKHRDSIDSDSSCLSFPESLKNEISMAKPKETFHLGKELLGNEVISLSNCVCPSVEGTSKLKGSDDTVGSETKVSKPQQRQANASLSLGNREVLALGKSLSPEQSNVLSTGAQSSDEDDSTALKILQDPSRAKYIAACHRPTVFRPSLESLRALRHRKAISMLDMQTRFSGKKESNSSEEYDADDRVDEDNRDRYTAKSKALKVLEGKSLPQSVIAEEHSKESSDKTLRKVKSVIEENFEKDEQDKAKLKEQILKRGFSCLNLPSQRNLETDHQKTKTSPLVSYFESKVPYSKELKKKDVAKLPLTSIDEVCNILEKCFKEDKNPTEMLEILRDTFSRFLCKSDMNRKDMADRLVRLLVDSRRYLYPDKFPSDLLFSSKQSPLCNSRLLRRIFPRETYNLIAPLLGMPEWHPTKSVAVKPGSSTDLETSQPRLSRESEDDSISFDMQVHPPSTKDISLPDEDAKTGKDQLNPYALFLSKPKRKAITWRNLTDADLEGYDPQATLHMRVKSMFDKICGDFCEWLRSLDGPTETIDEEVLKDMFSIDIDIEAARAVEVSIKERRTVPPQVAEARRCPEATELAAIRRLLIADARAEKMPARVTAFGKALPRYEQFRPPKNCVRERWLTCKHVPRDLETMDAVWKDITGLSSVKGFCQWLREHPEVEPPRALKKMMENGIDQRQQEDDETFAHLELDVERIGRLKVEDTSPEETY